METFNYRVSKAILKKNIRTKTDVKIQSLKILCIGNKNTNL